MKTVSLDALLHELAPVEQAGVEARYKELLRTLPLASLRSECDLTQGEMAARLEVSQAAISKLEGRSDMLLSTLARYVRALAGSLKVSVVVDAKEFVIAEADDAQGTFVLRQAAPFRHFIDRAAMRYTAERSGYLPWDFARPPNEPANDAIFSVLSRMPNDGSSLIEAVA